MKQTLSANLGFLWKHLPLTQAIRAAKEAGFEAVEFHWPYDTPPNETKSALQSACLAAVGLNTIRGDKGENGLLALPHRQEAAHASIHQAIDYAAAIGAKNVHALAGFGQGDAAKDCYVQNLNYACEIAAPLGITILIEPLNKYDAPNYFLQTTTQAQRIIEAVGAPNLKMMFDCYHVQIMEGDLSRRLERLLPIIGHVQIASVPQRAEPNLGEVNYRHIFNHLDAIGYKGAVGAEYAPVTDEESGLAWMDEVGR